MNKQMNETGILGTEVGNGLYNEKYNLQDFNEFTDDPGNSASETPKNPLIEIDGDLHSDVVVDNALDFPFYWAPPFNSRYHYKHSQGHSNIKYSFNYDNNNTGRDEEDEIEDAKVGRVKLLLAARDDNPGDNERGERSSYIGWRLGLGSPHNAGKVHLRATFEVESGDIADWLKRESKLFKSGGQMQISQYLRLHVYKHIEDRLIPVGYQIKEWQTEKWYRQIVLGGNTGYQRRGDNKRGEITIEYNSNEIIDRDVALLI
jgi:hypothetical protein